MVYLRPSDAAHAAIGRYFPKVSPTVIGRTVADPPVVLTLVKREATTRRVLPVPSLNATAAPPPKPIFDSEAEPAPVTSTFTLQKPSPALSMMRAGALAGFSAYTTEAMPP